MYEASVYSAYDITSMRVYTDYIEYMYTYILLIYTALYRLMYMYIYILTCISYIKLILTLLLYTILCYTPYPRDLPLQTGPYAARVAGYQKKELSTVGHGVTMGDKSAIKQCTIGGYVHIYV